MSRRGRGVGDAGPPEYVPTFELPKGIRWASRNPPIKFADAAGIVWEVAPLEKRIDAGVLPGTNWKEYRVGLQAVWAARILESAYGIHKGDIVASGVGSSGLYGEAWARAQAMEYGVGFDAYVVGGGFWTIAIIVAGLVYLDGRKGLRL